MACSIVLAFGVVVGLLTDDAAFAAKKPFCDAVVGLSDTIDVDPQDSNATEARKVGKGFKTAAKQAQAPKKVRKALTTIGDFFSRLAGADSTAEKVAVSARYGKKYSKAVLRFGTHYASECFGSVVTPGAPTTGSSGSTSNGGGGTLGGVINGRNVALEVGQCVVSASNGVVRSQDGSFELSWANGSYQLVWTAQGTTYSGPVTVQLVGKGGAFTGTAAGVLVTGAFQCP